MTPDEIQAIRARAEVECAVGDAKEHTWAFRIPLSPAERDALCDLAADRIKWIDRWHPLVEDLAERDETIRQLRAAIAELVISDDEELIGTTSLVWRDRLAAVLSSIRGNE